MHSCVVMLMLRAFRRRRRADHRSARPKRRNRDAVEGGTQRAQDTRLNTEIARIVNSDELRSALVTAGFDIGAGTAEDFERNDHADNHREEPTSATWRIP
jgi:hypothetical protein